LSCVKYQGMVLAMIYFNNLFLFSFNTYKKLNFYWFLLILQFILHTLYLVGISLLKMYSDFQFLCMYNNCNRVSYFYRHQAVLYVCYTALFFSILSLCFIFSAIYNNVILLIRLRTYFGTQWIIFLFVNRGMLPFADHTP